MYYPVSRSLLSHSLLHESLLGPEQLHGQLVVGWGKDVLELVPHPALLSFTGQRAPDKNMMSH